MGENVPRQITFGLRGIDILTVQEDERSGISDPDVLARATELQRVLFTRDDYFFAIATAHLQTETPFSGIIYAHQQLASIGDCVRDLELLASAGDLEDFENRIEFLPL